MKPVGCKDMSADECALALQLYLDGAVARRIAPEVGRARITVERIVRRTFGRLGRRRVYRGPRSYLVDKLMPVVWIKNPCDCQHLEETPGGAAGVSVSCPFHGDADARTLESCP